MQLLEEETDEDEPEKTIMATFKSVLNHHVEYELGKLNISQCFKPLRSNPEIPDFAKRFVNCVVKFDQHFVLVTGFDLFCHFQKNADDCATSMKIIDSKEAVGKIQRKTYLSTSFQEISIYFGIYELLLTSGYTATKDCIIPFLGSAFSDVQLNVQSSKKIYIDKGVPAAVNTERLLRQYAKLHSNKPWGFYSCREFNAGFTPVIPVAYYDHVSQKNKDINLHQFASRLLSLFCSNGIVTKEMMVELWLFMAPIPLFPKVIDTCSSPPTDF